jgi:hypothetical protein
VYLYLLFAFEGVEADVVAGVPNYEEVLVVADVSGVDFAVAKWKFACIKVELRSLMVFLLI